MLTDSLAVGLDSVGLDTVGLDTVGLDSVGLDTVGLDTEPQPSQNCKPNHIVISCQANIAIKIILCLSVLLYSTV